MGLIGNGCSTIKLGLCALRELLITQMSSKEEWNIFNCTVQVVFFNFYLSGIQVSDES